MQMTRILTLLLLLFMAAPLAGQVSFEAKVSKKRLGINERLRVDFEMNEDGDNFRPPSFEGFRVLGGPNQSISNSWINGRRTYSKTYSFFLAPQKKGALTIGQAVIEIDGALYKSLPISVEITEAVKRSGDGGDADYLASENVHLVAEVSNTNPYLNEAITVVYKLYVSNEVSITANWREIDAPKYADFWSQSIDQKGQMKIYEGQYNGAPYRYVILRTTVLYPQKTGTLEIEPLTLDVPIDVRSNKRDFIGRFMMTRVNKTISAGRQAIKVKELPLAGQPEDFSGAVGSFDFAVNTNKKTLDVGESLALKVGVSGSGNLKLFELPEPNFPGALEVYEPTRQDKIRTKSSGMTGFFGQEYTIVPQAQGAFTVQPLTFSYFDPKKQTYITKTSEPVSIEVANGPVASTEIVLADKEPSSTQGDLPTQTGFKYIKLVTDWKSIKSAPFFNTMRFWLWLFLPLVLIPLWFAYKKWHAKYYGNSAKNAYRQTQRLAKKYLSEAKAKREDHAKFYEALERALHNFLKAKLDLSTSELSQENTAHLLTQKGLDQELIARWIGLFKRCDMARYAPSAQGAADRDFDAAKELITLIDKQLN